MGTTEHTAVSTGYAWTQDADGIVTITMADPDSAVNTMNAHFVGALGATLDRLEAERDTITGVILASASDSWFAGGDLHLLRAADPARAAEETAHIDHVKALLRRLETLGRPVVAAMHGTALGGGLEVALACHHRIAASDVPGARFGLPEVSLGLLPGGGGTIRTVRMLGLQRALQEVILPATRFRAEDALAVGIVDEVAPLADLEDRARAWIAANPAPVQPWDEPGFGIPGGSPASPAVAAMLPAMPALLRAQLQGAPLPAPRAALAAAVEGAAVDLDTASKIETRYFVSLTHTQVAKNLITAFFFDRQEVESGRSRPGGIPRSTIGKLGVIGDGAAAAAFARLAAGAGIDVVQQAAAADADVVIEVLSEPARHSDGIGVHAAPTDAGPLIEIVRDADTSDERLAKTFDLVRQLGRTPIVVDASRGFFTSRILGRVLAEAVAAVGDGVEPASVEQAALQAGFPAGALHMLDERGIPQSREALLAATTGGPHPAVAVLDWMLDGAGRPGRSAGRGFFDYDEDGGRLGIWPGLRERYDSGRTALSLQDLQERMLFAGALEAVACLDEGVIASVAAANVGSILGAGFPAWTGGVLQYAHQYEGGLPGFVARARDLAATAGARFEPPASLVARAETAALPAR